MAFAISQTTRAQQYPKDTFDLAFAVCSTRYTSSRYLYTGLGGLTTFFWNFSLQYPISANQTRVAVVNAYLKKDNNSGNFAQYAEVLLTLENGQSPEAIQDAAARVREVEHFNRSDGTTVEYDSKDIVDNVTSRVFGPGRGDRPEVPNLIVFIGSAPVPIVTPTDERRALANWSANLLPNIPIRMLAQDFGLPARLLLDTAMGVGNEGSDLPVRDGAPLVVTALKNLSSKCLAKPVDTQCYYNDLKTCVRDRIFEVIEDSHPKGYCYKGPAPGLFHCANASECEEECKKSVQWSCDCKSGIEQQIRNATGLEEFYEYCPPISKETRKCSVPCLVEETPKKFPIAAIATICGLGGFLLVLVIAISIYFFVRKRMRRRRAGPAPRRQQPRFGQRSPRGFDRGRRHLDRQPPREARGRLDDRRDFRPRARSPAGRHRGYSDRNPRNFSRRR